MQKKVEDKNALKKKRNTKSVEFKDILGNKELNKSHEKNNIEKKNSEHKIKFQKNTTMNNNNTQNNENPPPIKEAKKENPTSCRCVIL